MTENLRKPTSDRRLWGWYVANRCSALAHASAELYLFHHLLTSSVYV